MKSFHIGLSLDCRNIAGNFLGKDQGQPADGKNLRKREKEMRDERGGGGRRRVNMTNFEQPVSGMFVRLTCASCNLLVSCLFIFTNTTKIFVLLVSLFVTKSKFFSQRDIIQMAGEVSDTFLCPLKFSFATELISLPLLSSWSKGRCEKKSGPTMGIHLSASHFKILNNQNHACSWVILKILQDENQSRECCHNMSRKHCGYPFSV